jgi:hypothetical protein
MGRCEQPIERDSTARGVVDAGAIDDTGRTHGTTGSDLLEVFTRCPTDQGGAA